MHICSMTGYATISHECALGTIVLDLKSVNSRFLDIQFRIHEELRSIEPKLRELMMPHVSRGKIECRVHFTRSHQVNAGYPVDENTVTELVQLQKKIREYFPDAPVLSIKDVLSWPGVIKDKDNQEYLNTYIFSTVATLISDFIASRVREGSALGTALIHRVDALEKIVARLAPMIPEVIEQFQQKTVARLQEALKIAIVPSISSPPHLKEELFERIRQEVTLYGIRIDVSEELFRLSTHLTEVRAILKKGGNVGKRLDFMMQELNREANTLGSKSATTELADAAMEMKLLIEQMREQVQNLE